MPGRKQRPRGGRQKSNESSDIRLKSATKELKASDLYSSSFQQGPSRRRRSTERLKPRAQQEPSRASQE